MKNLPSSFLSGTKVKVLLVLILALSIPLSMLVLLREQDLRQNASEVEDKPNIIVIMTDDQRWDMMENMPTISKLANNGITFTNFFHNNPWCCPSRATFLTSLYTHNTGVWTVGNENGGYKRFLENGLEDKTVARWLQQAGYKTALFGKYLNGYNDHSHVPTGWDRWFAMVRGQRYYDYEISDQGQLKKYGKADKDYITDVLRDQAKAFIEETNQPFFLFFASPAPHSTTDRDDTNDEDEKHLAQIAPRHQADCKVTPWKKPPSFNEKDTSDKPAYIRKRAPRNEADIREFRRSQICSLRAVDEAVEHMLVSLGDRADNTVIMFLSDNGYSFGEHKFFAKPCFYEECIRGPFVVSYPKKITGAQKSHAMISNVDLAVTIADLAGAPVPDPTDGMSFMPIITKQRDSHRNDILLEVQNNSAGNPTLNFKGTGIRSPFFKYVEYENGEKELYDLRSDPYELKNIAKQNSAGTKSVLRDISARLRSLRVAKPVTASESKPNVIVIQTDDQRFDALETMPSVTNRLAKKGITFTNGYVSTPLCCPSRASFLSGLYAHNTDVWGVFDHPKFIDNEDQTIAVWLKNAGYRTALIGKYMNGYNDPKYIPPGWDRWLAFIDGQGYYDYKLSDNGTLRESTKNEYDYATDVFRRESVQFIKETQRPFFLFLNTNAPHSTVNEGISGYKAGDPIPAERHRDCTVSTWKRPPSINEADISDKAKWVTEKIKPVSIEEFTKFRKLQLCSLKAVDETVDAVLDALGPRVDNTIIVFYSDNGYSYGEHKFGGKNCYYEECSRVPFVISYPRLLQSEMKSDELVTQLDLAPTIAELAGVEIPVPINGKSLVPLFSDPTANIRDSLLIEMRNNWYEGYVIRKDDIKYVELSTNEKEFYDLAKDPYELVNQIKNPSYKSKIDELAAELDLLKDDKEPTVATSP
jgi:N-acetylglucosamine-6-sulfatase